MKKPEKNKDTEINQYAVGYTRGFNQCNSKWEKYHDWVLEQMMKDKSPKTGDCNGCPYNKE